MAQVIDTLQVLIEADSQGLETQLKSATETVSDFIKEMNEGTVNWKSIFTKSLSPALIAGVASTVALGITKALSFQNALATAAAQSTQEFSDAKGSIGQSALGISNATGQSANSVASALGRVAKYFKDAALQETLVEKASRLASMGFGEVEDIAGQLAETLSNWGIETVPQAITAMDALYASAAESKLGFSEFVDVISKNGVKLKGALDLKEAAAGLAELSRQAGFTKETAVNAFESIAEAAGSPEANLKFIATGVGDIATALKEKGIAEAFDLIRERMQGNLLIAQALGREFNLLPDSVKAFNESSKSDFEELKLRILELEKSVRTIDVAWEDSRTSTDKLKEAFNRVTNALAEFLDKSGALSLVNEVLEKIAAVVSIVSEGIGGMGDRLSDLAQGGGLLPQLKNIVGLSQESADNMKNTNDLLQKQLDIRDLLTSSGVGFDKSQISSFIRAGTNAGLSLDELLSGVQGNYNTQFANTFNISSQQGGERSTAEMIMKKLYEEFQGIK